jgi:hypothetical protein
MIFILIGLVAWLPAIVGLGSPLLIIRRNLLPRPDSSHLIFVALCGLAVLGTLGNLLNLFVPISPQVALILFAGGWLLFILNARYAIKTFSLGLIVFGLIVVIYVAYSGQKPVFNYDSGLYHLQAIRWITSSKTPLGLANLHSRLGFNSSWFSVAASLEIPHLEYKSSFILNTLLVFVYGLGIGQVASAFRFARKVRLSDIFLILSGLVWFLFAQSKFVSSPSPDTPVLALTLVSTYASIKAMESEEGWFYYGFIAFFIAVFAITVKFTALPLLLAPMATLSWNFYRHRERWDKHKSLLRRLLIISSGTTLLVLLPWMLRGILLSGCAAFPLSLGCFPSLTWATQVSCSSPACNDLISAGGAAAWIKSWARQPNLSPDVVLSNWNWLIPWLDNFLSGEVVRKSATLLFLGTVLLWLARGEKKPSVQERMTYMLPASVSFLGIMFWFLTAPDLRFAEGYFWSLGLLIFSAGIYGLYTAYQLMRFNRIILIGLAVIALVYGNGLGKINHQELYVNRQEIFLSWPAIPSADLEERFTKDGVRVLSPTSGDQCWNADLPCTPYFDADLKISLDSTGLPERFQRVTLEDK